MARFGILTTSNAMEANRFLIANPAAAAESAGSLKVLRKQQVSINQFLTWLQREQPAAYGMLKLMRRDLTSPQMPLSGLRGIGEVTDTSAATDSWYAQTTDFLKTTVPALLQFKAQNNLIELNLERAKQGLSPISADQVTPGFNLGLSGDTRTLVYAGVGALALVGLFYIWRKHK